MITLSSLIQTNLRRGVDRENDLETHPLSERDICTKFITPAIQAAGWQQAQFREEVSLTDGRVMVRGRLAARVRNPEAKGGPKRADYVLYARPNVPLAVVEAKQARFLVGAGYSRRWLTQRCWTLPSRSAATARHSWCTTERA